ncbi:AmmeMemoRadiSam system radical SAM enzyme [Planctomycetota bacterium]
MNQSVQQRTAELWQPLDDQQVCCDLCAHRCMIAPGKLGRCCVRKNVGGTLITLTYGQLQAAAADPIEKKPLYHFLPGSQSFSIATEGCNFRCDFCQNWQLSQAPFTDKKVGGRYTTPEQIVTAAQTQQCASIAYTYTEPTIFMEIAAATGRLARTQGLANVFVSNGYQTPESLRFAQPWLDGINIDLKAFNDDFYRQHCKARLDAVLKTLHFIAHETDIWLEITTLLIPGANDSAEDLKAMTDWIVTHVGPQVPWHISRFHPQYRYDQAGPTPMATLEEAYAIGKAAGLQYVYLGNVPGKGYENTHCHQCNRMLIERSGFTIVSNFLQQGGCPDCGTPMAGYGLDRARSNL